MSARVAAWSLAALGISLSALYHVLDLLNAHRFAPPVVGTLVGVAFLVVGALIASNRPRNPIGWIYLACLTLISFGGGGSVSEQYAYYTLVTRPGSLPAVDWVVWAGSVLLSVAFATLVFFSLLLFPDGRLPSPRWRPAAAAAVAAIALLGVGAAVLSQEDVLSPGVTVANPIRLFAAGPLLDALSGATFAFAVGIALACVASVFVRFRAASGVERLQLKWFAYGAAWIPAVAAVGVFLALVAPGGLDPNVGSNLWPLSVAGIPIATAIAILRLRLYDIDLVIERTLVYAALSAALAATYWILVLLLQSALRPVTGGSEVAVAGSTLATLALVQPLRSRIQAGVDRRFYRSRYDAERTVDRLVRELAEEVDLSAVRSRLLAVIGETLEPTHVSLWFRDRAR